MNKITVFKNEEFGEIRTVIIDNELWFIGRDVADALGYAKPENAIAAHVDVEDKTTTLIQGDGSNYKSRTTIINESGLYSLIMSSKLPMAKKFKHWVTSEVLPSIRKNGVYMTDEKAFDITHNPQSLADLLLQAGEQLKRKDFIIQEMKPKAFFADSVASSDDSILIGQLAKLISQNGKDIGQNRLFSMLREDGYLCKKGDNRNLPTQKAMRMHLLEIKERTVNNPDGSIRITKTTKVTGKGQIYFVEKYGNHNT